MKRLQKSLWSFITSLGLNGLSILLTFWSIPLILQALGENTFGQYRILLEWLGFAGLATSAFAGFFGQKISRLTSSTQQSQFVHEMLRTSFELTILLAPALVLFVYFTPHLLRNLEVADEIRFAASLGVLAFALLPGIVFQSHLEALNRGYTVNILMLIQRSSVILLSVVFALQLQTLASQFLALLIGQVLFLFLLLIFSPLKLDFERILKAPGIRSSLQKYFQEIKPYFKIDLAGKLSLSADALIISFFLPANQVTLFYLWVRLPQLILGQLMSFGNSIWSGFASLHREGGNSQWIFLRASKMISILSMAAAGSVLILNEDFLKWWLARPIDIPLEFQLILSANIILVSIISFFGWIMTSLGDENLFARISLQAASINVAAGLVFTWQFQLLGPILGSLIAYGIFKAYRMIQCLAPALNISKGKIAIAIFSPLAAGGLTLGLVFRLPIAEPFPLKLVSLLVFNLLFTMGTWIFILDSEEKNYIKAKFK